MITWQVWTGRNAPPWRASPARLVSGAWVFKGTRMPVQTVFDNLEAGMSVDEITEVFDVTPEEVKAVSLCRSRLKAGCWQDCLAHDRFD